MLKRTLVAIAAAFLIGATAPSRDPHTLEIDLSATTPSDPPHIFLGIAVLGHHVSEISGGWLVKRKAAPFVSHFDWIKYGEWDGLTRSAVGPRDTSAAQLNEVIERIERLGYPQSAIRAWRVPAPVGYDDFNEGDKVLTIGEILVDLGPPAVAYAAFDRWWDIVAGKNDPFRDIPLTNVDYVDWIYIQPHCDRIVPTMHDLFMQRASTIASSIAQLARTTATLTTFASASPDNVLCPANIQPHFYRTGGPPHSIHEYDLTAQQYAAVSFALKQGIGASTTRIAAARPDYAFALAERYLATIGTASVTVTPEARVTQFEFDLGYKGRPRYSNDEQAIDARIKTLAGLVVPSDLLTVRRSEGDREFIDVYIRARERFAQQTTAFRATMRRSGQTFDAVTTRDFVKDCSQEEHRAVQLALAESRQKAEIFARLLHARVVGLGAARVNGDFGGSVMCGVSPQSPMSVLADAMSAHETLSAREATLGTTIDAAWTIVGPNTAKAARRTPASYSGSASGSGQTDAELRAFAQEADLAVKADPRIFSAYEMPPTHLGATTVDESLVVLR